MRCRLEKAVIDQAVRTSRGKFAQRISVKEIHPKLQFELNRCSRRTLMPLLFDALKNFEEGVVAFERAARMAFGRRRTNQPARRRARAVATFDGSLLRKQAAGLISHPFQFGGSQGRQVAQDALSSFAHGLSVSSGAGPVEPADFPTVTHCIFPRPRLRSHLELPVHENAGANCKSQPNESK